MAKKKESSQERTDTSFASSLIDAINAKYKKDIGTVAYKLEDSTLAPTNVSDFVSTGCTTLDMAISNRENGGYPVGKIVELIGLEQSGKSLLAAHAIKETQKKGGIGIIIDTESAVSKEFLSAIGVDLKKNFVYVQHEVIEDVFSSVETIVEQMRASNKDVIVTIVVDSVMGASTKDEIEGNYDKDGWATQKAIIISKAMRKLTNLLGREKILLIFTNQLRQNLQARPGMGDSYTTSGGKAIGFHSSIRVKLVKKGKIQGPEKDLPLGITTEAEIIKNRIGPPHRKASFNIMYNSGIDDVSSIMDFLKDKGIATSSGAWYTYKYCNRETGEIIEEIRFQRKDFHNKLFSREEIRKDILSNISDYYITTYIKRDGSDEGDSTPFIHIEETEDDN